jgi:hypothetical protein
VLIPSLYATSLRTRSLRSVRVLSDQNTRWRLPFHFSNDKRQEFLVSPYFLDTHPLSVKDDRRDAAHVRQAPHVNNHHKIIIIILDSKTKLKRI